MIFIILMDFANLLEQRFDKLSLNAANCRIADNSKFDRTSIKSESTDLKIT